MSPRRTQALHQGRDLEHLPPICLVGLKRPCLRCQRRALLQALRSIHHGPANRLRSAQSCGLQSGQCLQGLVIQTD